MKPETVSDSETVQRTKDRNQYSQSGTETSRKETEPETVTQSELFTVSTLPETETRAVCGSEPPRKCKPPTRP